jgi:DNA polymerase-3 subunit alpha
MAAKAVIRDVGRVLDLPFNFVDGIAKLIPRELEMTLDKALEQEPILKERREKEEEVNELLALALRLEGLTRNVGTHAGGVLISPGKITDFSPMYCQQGSDSTVSQYDKDDVEAVGLVKFDFLGLRTLTILAMAVEWANQLRVAQGEAPVDLATLALDDPDTYKLLKVANTTAVFQLESSGMKEMLKQAKPDCFEDIIALVSLYRPGPMDLIPDFCKRKNKEVAVEYPHPAVEPVLKETYGIMVYQEQVMQMAQLVGGYSLGGADLLRRAMGKKNKDEMDAQRAVFVAGAMNNGTSEFQAGQLFDLMEKFAGYGFNKSHAAAYALVAYHTAWLKAHYPAAFMAATMSADMNNTDSVHIFFKDSQVNGVKILPPDINRSEFRFTPLDEKTVLYGLGAVKGTGDAAISVILAARKQDGPFTDLFDFCRRLDLRKVNRRVVESLIRAGAFDAIDPNRAAMLAAVGVAMDVAGQGGSAQDSLFGESHDIPQQALPKVQPWNERQQLVEEKAAMGFYFSGHPFSAWRKDVNAFVRTDLASLTAQKQAQMLAGVVMATRNKMTTRGKMAFVVLDDGSAQVEVAVGGELLMQHQALLKEDQLLIVEGRVSKDEYNGAGGLRVNANRLFDLATARTSHAQMLKLSCNGQADAVKLKQFLSPYIRREACRVVVNYHNQQAACEMTLGDDWRVELRDELLETLRHWLGEDGLKILYHST